MAKPFQSMANTSGSTYKPVSGTDLNDVSMQSQEIRGSGFPRRKGGTRFIWPPPKSPEEEMPQPTATPIYIVPYGEREPIPVQQLKVPVPQESAIVPAPAPLFTPSKAAAPAPVFTPSRIAAPAPAPAPALAPAPLFTPSKIAAPAPAPVPAPVKPAPVVAPPVEPKPSGVPVAESKVIPKPQPVVKPEVANKPAVAEAPPSETKVEPTRVPEPKPAPKPEPISAPAAVAPKLVSAPQAPLAPTPAAAPKPVSGPKTSLASLLPIVAAPPVQDPFSAPAGAPEPFEGPPAPTQPLPKGASVGARSGPRRGKGVLTQPRVGIRVPECSLCTTAIRGPFVTALGKTWCPNHFLCVNAQCQRPLQDVGFVEEKGELYCDTCFEQYLAPVCFKCNKKVKGDCLNAIGHQYHPDCFSCAYCGKHFGNVHFYLEDGLPYCEEDWNELFTTKCVGCGFPIEAGDRWVEALNHNYHSQCFNCTLCKKNLEGKSFIAKDGKPFCKSHAR